MPDSKKVNLPGNLTYQERIEIVSKLIEEYYEYFTERWENTRTMVCLDVMATYLSQSKEFKDGSTLSYRKKHELENPQDRKSPYALFSELSLKQQASMGLVDVSEDVEQSS
jgi:hypothetical protein